MQVTEADAHLVFSRVEPKADSEKRIVEINMV